jgi:hypothetical protein
VTKEKIEVLEKLVISLLVQIQEYKLKQDNVNRGLLKSPKPDQTRDDLFTVTSYLCEDLLQLIFLKRGREGIDFCE